MLGKSQSTLGSDVCHTGIYEQPAEKPSKTVTLSFFNSICSTRVWHIEGTQSSGAEYWKRTVFNSSQMHDTDEAVAI
jgi:hypothetical protein